VDVLVTPFGTNMVRSLEWGVKYAVPFSNKHMRSPKVNEPWSAWAQLWTPSTLVFYAVRHAVPGQERALLAYLLDVLLALTPRADHGADRRATVRQARAALRRQDVRALGRAVELVAWHTADAAPVLGAALDAVMVPAARGGSAGGS